MIAHGRESERSVFPGVFLVANANQAYFQQLHHGGQHFVARQAGKLQVAGDPAANPGQRTGEGEDVNEFCLITHLAPARMITVLFAPASIATRRLEMTEGRWANPHLCPGWWDGERVDSRYFLG